MPARRKPFHVLEDLGAIRKDPARYRDRQHVPESDESVGEPPDFLTKGQATAWRELAADAPPGVLRNSDRMHLELTSYLLWKIRTDPNALAERAERIAGLFLKMGMAPRDVKEFEREMLKKCIASASEKRLLVKCLTCMRITPDSRYRV